MIESSYRQHTRREGPLPIDGGRAAPLPLLLCAGRFVEQRGDLRVAVRPCSVGEAHAVRVLGERVGAELQQRGDGVSLASGDGGEEGGRAHLGGGLLDVGAVLDEDAQHLLVAVGRREEEGTAPVGERRGR